MICEKCGVEMENSEKVCRNCGALQKGAKFCQHCGEAIDSDCVICPKCGKQVQQLKQEPPQVVINNTNTNTVTASATATANGVGAGRAKNKWIALCLCIFFGLVGAHKFYEGKIGMGILYLLTGGLFVIGAIVDTIVILMKPNPYYV
jgi:restriction system protein